MTSSLPRIMHPGEPSSSLIVVAFIRSRRCRQRWRRGPKSAVNVAQHAAAHGASLAARAEPLPRLSAHALRRAALRRAALRRAALRRRPSLGGDGAGLEHSAVYGVWGLLQSRHLWATMPHRLLRSARPVASNGADTAPARPQPRAPTRLLRSSWAAAARAPARRPWAAGLGEALSCARR